ncbi:hypothetical protein ABIF65_009290 [Bradyrhizobium japonicum]|nr:hypothetical protein [Bradyrhizobium japonicum]MCP1774840.1 hypothetical protein [Bradyrhizobium japonicum]MCP1865399.1 hypothetical protein [Bradyrhizobium japonicum]MCP1895829.1 hypothetical protein [Bradyrhizobium japonicum]MCP1962160.1 hypothetical protein [Bradyrhizobium japonicum]
MAPRRWLHPAVYKSELKEIAGSLLRCIAVGLYSTNSAGTISRARGDLLGRDNCFGEVRIKLPADGVMADVCLGVTVTSLYTLVGLGVVLVFM